MAAEVDPSWTFLSNHAHVLLCVAQDKNVRVRDIATDVGITERAVLRILCELEEADFITRERQGRRTVYSVHKNRKLRHPIESSHTVGELIKTLASK